MKFTAFIFRSRPIGKWLALTGCALLFIFSSFPACAEQSPQRRANAEKRFEELAARLQLADSQKAPVKTIFHQSMERRMEVLQKNGVDGSASFADLPRRTRWAIAKEMRSIRSDTDKRLKEVLTPDQFNAFSKLRDEKREEMKEAFQEKQSAR